MPPVLRNAPASIEPCKSVLNQGAAWEDDDAQDVATPDDRAGEAVEVRDSSVELQPGIAEVGEEEGEGSLRIM